jgi:hypothetical protein
MECSQGLCVTSGNNVGIGTDSPAQKLEVDGNGLFTGDVCNGSGKCLSGTYQTNVIAGSNPTCPTGQTAIMRAYNGTWYIPSQVTTWSQVSCGQVMSSDGTALLVNSQHTSKNCTDNSGTVIGDGSGNNMCKFISSSCPTGWNKYANWTATSPSGCSAWPSGCYSHTVFCSSCSVTGSHAWSNVAQETQTFNVYAGSSGGSDGCFCSGGCGSAACTAYASINQIGCY